MLVMRASTDGGRGCCDANKVANVQCHSDWHPAPGNALRYCHAATGSMIADASCMRQAAAVTAPTSGIDANTAPAELLTVSCMVARRGGHYSEQC